MKTLNNYLDEDVAYLLGLIFARGNLTSTPRDYKLQISFPIKAINVTGLKTKYDQQTQMQLASFEIRERLTELLSADIHVNIMKTKIELVARFSRNNIIWRVLSELTKGYTSYINFRISKNIFEASKSIQKSFIRGIADACGYINKGTIHPNGMYRVFIGFTDNWFLPVDLCNLLQQYLEIPVNCILWGHPNLRDPQKKNPKIGIREHQLRVWAHDFEPIGFDISYKNELLKEYIEHNLSKNQKTHPCHVNDMLKKKKLRVKHPKEKSVKIPKLIRGKHFNNYRELCKAFGCEQRQDQLELIEVEDEE